MTNYWSLFIVCLTLWGCSSPSSEENKIGKVVDTTPSESQLKYGFEVLKSTCISCHNPNPSANSLVGPTLSEIKIHYLKAYPKRNDFINGFKRFLNQPIQEHSIIPNAINTYGLMPQISLQDQQIINIASYLFSESVETDSWFINQYPKEIAYAMQTQDSLSTLDKGFNYAMATKSVLGKNLKQQLKRGGSLGALEFCNTNALQLTDSVKTYYGVQIKRVSDKPRNEKNKANSSELKVIESFKKMLYKKESLLPIETYFEEEVVGYYPIVTNAMCTQCHGEVDKIDKLTLNKIKTYYPNDQAIGYKSNELRGIWVVSMPK